MNETEMQELLDAWVAWIREQEPVILAQGAPLTEEEMAIAKRVGVAQPGRIRVLDVPKIEIPADLIRQMPGLSGGQIPGAPGGMCCGHGIMLAHMPAMMRPALLAHEMTHTHQIEEIGLEPFARTYFEQVQQHGYLLAPLEREAIGNMMPYMMAVMPGMMGMMME